MKLDAIVTWLDKTLKTASFDDVSNNGLQVARSGDTVTKVAFAVDADLASVEAAIRAGAQLLVAHHGISWGGGIRRLTGGVYNVVRTALAGDLAIYACHLPLDAHPTLGNNVLLARYLGLKRLVRAFAWRGVTIGVIGTNAHGRRIGLCTGGAGGYAEEAKALGCDLYVTGEADWGERVAARNAGIPMICAGHYATEVFGVRAVARALTRALHVKTVFLDIQKGSDAP